MNRKTLTVAIAGALAAPMAAQAVDFTISGHVNRALFIVAQDSDADYGGKEGGTKAQVRNNGGSSSRIRATGSTELMDGNTVGIQFEYEDNSNNGLNLRHANVQLTNSSVGKITIGKGSEAGDGSAYSDTTGVFGIGHGAGTSPDFTLGDYFGSLDAGGRAEMIRYDSPAIGPMSAAISVANGDQLSALLKLKSEFSGTSFGAQLATLQFPNEKDSMGTERDRSIVGASAGATLPSGLTLSGAWAKGKDMSGVGATAATAGTPAIEGAGVSEYGCVTNTDPAVKNIVNPTILNTGGVVTACPSGSTLGFGWRQTREAVDAVPGAAAQKAAWTDPSYFQVEVGYKFDNSAVAVSWYKSSDFVTEGSEGTALGLGVKHTLPKAGAELYAAVQKYSVERSAKRRATAALKEQDETVFVVGTRVKF